MATARPCSLRYPLYTAPKPPCPSFSSAAKLFVASTSSWYGICLGPMPISISTMGSPSSSSSSSPANPTCLASSASSASLLFLLRRRRTRTTIMAKRSTTNSAPPAVAPAITPASPGPEVVGEGCAAGGGFCWNEELKYQECS
ncbi:Os08g0125850 [Oryza sativa Japonica Group]|uniref:Os08g0125850 protein n=1 Tax=Oryza sativa subsp. japonica TaxID=39947 RepID=A0A0P0XB59_ORYSJ|nr:hypothetical protein EE612_041906 [Oryza sativa]BAT03654.1 Os08g0125850 [Oryza sativa Japonica Group]